MQGKEMEKSALGYENHLNMSYMKMYVVAPITR